jgi:opacity protein-like surface antigen
MKTLILASLLAAVLALPAQAADVQPPAADTKALELKIDALKEDVARLEKKIDDLTALMQPKVLSMPKR